MEVSWQSLGWGIYRWEIFSPGHKVELTSHAVMVETRLYLFDPIQAPFPAITPLLEAATQTVIVLTNGNHERQSAQWQQELQIPVFGASEVGWTHPQVQPLEAEQGRWRDWQVRPLTGGAEGELAFLRSTDSLLVVGDAVSNLSRYGPLLLPEQYCTNQAQLRLSLGQLAEEPFDTLLCAHGSPLRPGAREWVWRLIQS